MTPRGSSKRWPPQVYTWRVDFEWAFPTANLSGVTPHWRSHSGGFEAPTAAEARQNVLNQLEKLGLLVRRVAVYAGEQIVMGTPISWQP